jgi:hypothetical protein
VGQRAALSAALGSRVEAAAMNTISGQFLSSHECLAFFLILEKRTILQLNSNTLMCRMKYIARRSLTIMFCIRSVNFRLIVMQIRTCSLRFTFFNMPNAFYLLHVVLYKWISLGEQLKQGKPSIFWSQKEKQKIIVCPFISLVRTRLDCWY